MKVVKVSKPHPMDQDVRVMFTDQSTRDFIVTASNVKEAEEIFDLIFNHMEQSINDLLKQYSVENPTIIVNSISNAMLDDMSEWATDFDQETAAAAGKPQPPPSPPQDDFLTGLAELAAMEAVKP